MVIYNYYLNSLAYYVGYKFKTAVRDKSRLFIN